MYWKVIEENPETLIPFWTKKQTSHKTNLVVELDSQRRSQATEEPWRSASL
jgi:hypothetical protein